MAFAVWPLSRILAEVTVGSGDWTWEEEWENLAERHAETGYLDKLEARIREEGIQEPVLIGTDGRLWDGHHRLCIAVRLCLENVPVETVESAPEQSEVPMTPAEMYDVIHFIAEQCDTTDREGTPITTALVREWLQGPKPGQRVSFAPYDETPTC